VAVEEDVSKTFSAQNKLQLLGKKTDTVLARCVVRALEHTVVSSDQSEAILPLKMSSHIDCIPINSARFKGLIVFGTSKNEHAGADFTRSIKNYLIKFMGERGEDLKDEGELELETEQYDFIKIGSEFGDFVTLSEHVGSELGLTYFESTGIFPSLAPANGYNMVEIPLETVEEGKTVGFDAYIHLPKNKKYIRYLQRGSIMESQQKKNLDEHKVRHFYIKNSDLKIFFGHCATSFVERIVKQFLSTISRTAS
jgi:hypothetical protein